VASTAEKGGKFLQGVLENQSKCFMVDSELLALAMRMLIGSNTTEFYALHRVWRRCAPMRCVWRWRGLWWCLLLLLLLLQWREDIVGGRRCRSLLLG